MTTPRGEVVGCNDDDVGVVDDNMSWGVYVPPPSNKNNGQPHGGYVRIVDAKGKSFPCGFSRPIGCVMETGALVSGKKRSRSSEKIEDVQTNDMDNNELDVAGSCESSKVEQQRKRTITEERLHPEEALFLHLRGLLRIVSNDSGESNEAREQQRVTHHTTLTTQNLFCNVLKECNIPLGSFLAYSHLRAQGYILTRYTEQRMDLLCRMKLAMKEAIQTNGSDFEATSQMNDNKERYKSSRTLRSQLSDDLATAPPPCMVTSLDENEIRLAYYAYNPNAHFKRSNPGRPDFGVAVMPFNNSQPTFDTLNSLVSMCEGADGTNNTKSGIPLRIVTVADGGAVIAFGVTNGEVPCINHSDKNDKAQK